MALAHAVQRVVWVKDVAPRRRVAHDVCDFKIFIANKFGHFAYVFIFSVAPAKVSLRKLKTAY